MFEDTKGVIRNHIFNQQLKFSQLQNKKDKTPMVPVKILYWVYNLFGEDM
jgi:hypothetical protein